MLKIVKSNTPPRNKEVVWLDISKEKYKCIRMSLSSLKNLGGVEGYSTQGYEGAITLASYSYGGTGLIVH